MTIVALHEYSTFRDPLLQSPSSTYCVCHSFILLLEEIRKRRREGSSGDGEKDSLSVSSSPSKSSDNEKNKEKNNKEDDEWTFDGCNCKQTVFDI